MRSVVASSFSSAKSSAAGSGVSFDPKRSLSSFAARSSSSPPDSAALWWWRPCLPRRSSVRAALPCATPPSSVGEPAAGGGRWASGESSRVSSADAAGSSDASAFDAK